MHDSRDHTQTQKMLELIVEFISQSSGLNSNQNTAGMIFVDQKIDGKTFKFHSHELEEVLQRTDQDGKAFIQVNFISGHKVLFTDQLVGFKPKETGGLDMSKVPKVVTTPDLGSVYEAIEETLSGDVERDQEIEILKKVYQAILYGGERVGFDLTHEKSQYQRLCSQVRTGRRISA